MATEKVGIYRKYHGPVPTDRNGRPLPKSKWPRKRAFRWAVRWFGTDGKRYSKSFKTRKEAEKYANNKQQRVQQGKVDRPKAITIGDFAAEHKKVMRHQVARSSLVDQMRALRMFMDHIGRNILLKNIKPRHAESFIAERFNSGVSVATVNKDIRTLRRIFNLAIEPRGYLSEKTNPFTRIKQRKITAKAVRYVSGQEFQALYSVEGEFWWKVFLLVAYTSAARTGELLNLTWSDVDFENDRIRIVRKDADDDVDIWEPKDHEGRVVPIPSKVTQSLANLQMHSPEGCPYVFIPAWRWTHIRQAKKAGKWSDGQILLNNLHRRFKTIRKRTCVSKCTLHDLRRSCITNWAKVLPIHVVQKLAGHSDIRTTRRYYLAVEESDLQEARKVQTKILRTNQTDPILTHSGKIEGFSNENENGKQMQLFASQVLKKTRPT